ncbi:MAG: UDP-N-acetylmuramoyl-L-alanine--D-glutamate ligase [Candidatus Omnitrophota bacterium]
MFDVKNKKIIVVGLGLSGRAAAQLLSERGAEVKVTESAEHEKVQKHLDALTGCSIEFELGRHTEEFCKDAYMVVTSPGVDPEALPLTVARSRNIPIIGELELGYLFCCAPVIAITGTNGKSTTTELIGDILACSGKHTIVCGNIGNPLSGEVDKLTEDSVAVVEVSSFQLETIKDFRPYIGVLLNVSEDHYERHGNLDAYKMEKFKIFRNQASDDWAVLHSDFQKDSMASQVKSRTVFFGQKDSMVLAEDGRVVADAGKFILEECDIPLKGIHNMENVACAVLVSKIMGVTEENIREGISAFRALHHRFEKVAEFEGVEFIDDSKATNIDATRRALESMNKKVVLIAGGRDKGGDYRSILPLIKEKVKTVVVIGEASSNITSAFGETIPVVSADSMSDAVEVSMQTANSGEAVMLSPMCSSFDMYTDYKHRGKVFQQEVRKLTGQ